MGRILAIDYGVKRTGVAVSDPLQLIAGGLETLDTKQLEKWIVEYCACNEVSTIVLGMPRHTTTGEPAQTWKYIEPLVMRLRRAHPSIDVELYDERYTSVLAHRVMLESGIGKMARRNKALVDKISATIILQSYMESREYKSKR